MLLQCLIDHGSGTTVQSDHLRALDDGKMVGRIAMFEDLHFAYVGRRTSRKSYGVGRPRMTLGSGGDSIYPVDIIVCRTNTAALYALDKDQP